MRIARRADRESGSRPFTPAVSSTLTRSTCEIWPGNPEQSLAVLLLPQSPQSDDETIYDVDTVVANSKSGAIIVHAYQPSAITSDAVALESVKIDTARWQLTPQVLAFGVSKTFSGSSSVNPLG